MVRATGVQVPRLEFLSVYVSDLRAANGGGSGCVGTSQFLPSLRARYGTDGKKEHASEHYCVAPDFKVHIIGYKLMLFRVFRMKRAVDVQNSKPGLGHNLRWASQLQRQKKLLFLSRTKLCTFPMEGFWPLL